MLTDIFAERYSKVQLWGSVGELERRLLVQGYRILSEQICPYYSADGNVSKRGKAFWTDIHSRLSMELGLKSLSSAASSVDRDCEIWMQRAFDNDDLRSSADQFIKVRLSLVEIGFRKREEEIAAANAALPAEMQAAKIEAAKKPGPGVMRVPGDRAEALKSINTKMNDKFRDFVAELNERFRQARCGLNYHNGYIQRTTDELSMEQIETPFWALVANPKWKNVDMDMKEALDFRDTDGRDPSWFAARALESTIKIVSEDKGWTHGKEKGAHNFIENLTSKNNGGFLTDWESNALKDFFTKVRNPFGHGPGKDKMPSLTPQQTDWAIETCMVWIKSIIRRT